MLLARSAALHPKAAAASLQPPRLRWCRRCRRAPLAVPPAAGEAAEAAAGCAAAHHNSSSSSGPARGGGSAFVLRPASAADIDRLAAIEAACGEWSAAWSAADIAAELDKAGSHALVAADGATGAPLGYAVAWLVAGELQLLELAVDPAHQGRGIGSALLQHLLDTVSCPEGCVLEVKAHNSRAIGLYSRLGFAAVGRRARFYADGADALLMARPPPSLLASPDTDPPSGAPPAGAG